MDNLNPLNVNISRCALSGKIYDLHTYEDFCNINEKTSDDALIEEKDGVKMVYPYQGDYPSNATNLQAGIYSAGCIDIVVEPSEETRADYIPQKIVELSNNNSIKEILEQKNIMSRLDEPWITSHDDITEYPILDEDKGEMRCLKSAINKKQIDIDKYAPRFGDNFLNDRRRMKDNEVTLFILKRFCKNLDMEAILTLRDKNPDVPNPMGCEISVSLTDDDISEDNQ